MKYLVFIIGLAIIILRVIGINFDLTSVGLFVFISIILLVKNFDNLTELSWLGLTVKLNSNLKELSKKTEALENEFEEIVSSIEMTHEEKEGPVLDDPTVGYGDPIPYYEEVEYHINFASPKIALMETTMEMEKSLRSILRIISPQKDILRISVKNMVRELRIEGFLNENFESIFNDFWELRNMIVHGSENKYTDSQIISLTESGLKILRTLKSIEYVGRYY